MKVLSDKTEAIRFVLKNVAVAVVVSMNDPRDTLLVAPRPSAIVKARQALMKEMCVYSLRMIP